MNNNAKRVDIMVDIETLGNKVDSTIFQISAIAFDIKSGQEVEVFNEIADISLNKIMNVTGDTIKWWLNTNKELLQELLNSGEKSSEDVLNSFHKWIADIIEVNGKENVYLWGNGILFDNKMIQHQFESQGLKYPIFYRNDRDVRTIVDLAGAKLGLTEKELKDKFKDSNLVHHNALDDVKYQIGLVVGCYKALIEKE